VTREAPILVTGMPRSGTTWVAHMLAAGGETVYVNEPLNPQHPPGGSPGILNADVDHRFHYICSDNDQRFLPAYHDLLALRYHPLAEIRRNHTVRDLPRQADAIRRFTAGKLRGRRVLVADPYAVFSIPWFVSVGFNVVVIVRHPAATVSSRKRLGWIFDVADLERQPLLVRDVLGPLGIQTRTEATEPAEQVIDTGSLLWNAIYSAVDSYRADVPGVRVVRHEDLSLEPLGEFERLYRELGLRFSEQASREIDRSTTGANPSELSVADPHQVRLDSRANLENWRKRLTDQEISRIRELTGEVAGRFYPDDAR
jgi:Sulfotransferase domain